MDDEKTPTSVIVFAIIFIFLYWWTIIGIIAGIFLMKGKSWARVISVLMCLLSIVLGFWLLVSVKGGDVYDLILMAVNIAIIYYLSYNKKANRFFGRMHSG